MLEFIIYIIGIVDGLKFFSTILAGVAFIVIILGYFFIYLDTHPNYDEYIEVFNRIKHLFIIPIFFAILAGFTPNSRTIAAMYLVPKLINNEQVNQFPDKALKLLNNKLDEWIQEGTK